MNQFRFSNIVHIVLLLGLTACQAQAALPAPTAVPPVAAATVVPSTAAPTVAPAQALTTFSPKKFNIPITLQHGPEWSVAQEYSDEFLLNYAGHDAGIAFINVENAKIADGIAFPNDFATWIQSPDSLFQVVESKSVLVGGFKGTQINALATCGDIKHWIILSGTGWKCPGVEQIGFIYLADVYGERVLIQIQGSPDGEDYIFIVEESQKILATVVFSKPQTPFSSKVFKIPMNLSVGADWQVGYDLPGKFAIDNENDFGLSFYIVTDAKLADPIDGHLIPFPQDFLAWIQSNPDFDAVTATPVTVAGIEGVQIDATPIWKSTTTKLKAFLSLSGDISLNATHGQPDGENIVNDPEQWRFILLNDVGGERVLIILVDGNGHKFEDAVQQSQSILDSVVFTK